MHNIRERCLCCLRLQKYDYNLNYYTFPRKVSVTGSGIHLAKSVIQKVFKQRQCNIKDVKFYVDLEKADTLYQITLFYFSKTNGAKIFFFYINVSPSVTAVLKGYKMPLLQIAHFSCIYFNPRRRFLQYTQYRSSHNLSNKPIYTSALLIYWVYLYNAGSANCVL